MKTVVSLQDLLEFEIRPGALLAEYERLTEAAVRGWAAAELQSIACPGCGRDRPAPAFDRFGLHYQECGYCGSLYLSPRPDERRLAEHALSSVPAQFWRERVLAATEDARREKILLPRGDWVHDALAEYAPGARLVHELVPNGGSLPADPADAITAFETLDRAADPRRLVAAAHAALRPGGILFVTAPCVSGFELQVLWERARSIAPPDKINLLSIRGFQSLFSEGWEIVEFSTPGLFDVEAVTRAVAADPDAPWPRFVRTLVSDTDAQQRSEFQEYLQRARLASFARLVVRKV